MSVAIDIKSSLERGFIDRDIQSIEKYDPKLLVNDNKRGMKVLTSIESELKACSEFYFSVAFITSSGVTALINVLDELCAKGIKGKIITSQYQNFTQPQALRSLLKFKNIELKIVTDENFHAKGYIFKKKDTYSFIVGSSNLTQDALCKNREWNLKLSSLEDGELMQSVLGEYNYTFENATTVTNEWIDEYNKIYLPSFIARTTAKEQMLSQVIDLNKINPNKMQVEALEQLELLRDNGKDKALLISATGADAIM